MKDTPFGRITRTSRRLNLLLLGILPLLLVLASALFWGLLHIMAQERERLTLDFSILVGYIHKQEDFLTTLRSQNKDLPNENLKSPIRMRDARAQERFGLQLFEGQQSRAETAFSLACEDASDCPASGLRLANLGGYLADFYSSFWAASYYPATTTFLVNENDSISLSVPAVDAPSGYEVLSARTYLAVTDALRTELHRLRTVRLRLMEQDLPSKSDLTNSNRVHWFRPDTLSGNMVGMIYADVPPAVWSSTTGKPASVYAATLFRNHRIDVFEETRSRPLYGGLWLSHREEGQLLGDGPPPVVTGKGLHFTADGMMLQLTDPAQVWTGVYRVNYAAFFQDNPWLPVGAALLLLLSVGGGMFFLRWYNRHVIAPAQRAQQDIVDNDAFNRTLIETAPVALCVLARPNGEVVFGNNLALEWLGVEIAQQLKNTPAANQLLRKVLSATGPGTIESLQATDGRPLYVAYAPTRYHNQDVVLCAFADISVRARVEHTLAEAKQEADKASEAKSTFLATMSHEIRTPLYGVLGTLELMGLTRLDNEQRQHLERMQSSSIILLQLISDILDITKIETGQLVLESAEFNPRELVQSCTNSYAPMAEQKGLLLFCCVDVDVPEWVSGDAGRIRQILSNLLSNAIKFSDSGHIIARLRAGTTDGDKTHLALQVVDTGIGIGKNEQTQLFVPFYQINGSSHTVRGTGLGLPICERLAKLMGSHIRVTSELGLGSSFALDLPVKVVPGMPMNAPDLARAQVHVRSPNRELTENICLWLTRWGARAAPAPAPLPFGSTDEVLLDVLYSSPDLDAMDWAGHHLFATASGKKPTLRTLVVDPSVESMAAGIIACLQGKQAVPSTPNTEIKAFAAPGLRVLVAEDNPINQATLQHQLEQLGCHVTMASDGAEALTLWKLGQYDLVLTDVNMPRMNGYDLAGELRAKGFTLPIIGVTANAMRDEEARCLAAGMTSWLVKPIALSTLRRHLQGRSASTSGLAEAVTRPLVQPETNPEPVIPAKYRALFVSTMETDMQDMERSMALGELTQLQKMLHRIRGALSVVQLTALTIQLESLEANLTEEGLNANTQEQAETLVQSLRAMLAKVDLPS